MRPGSLLSLLLLFMALNQCVADVSPDVVSRGKRATALVETAEGTGSAFCIDASGLFVTNHHVIASPGGVCVVLYSGEKNQEKLDAKIVFQDKDYDLAVLQVHAHHPLTALEVADSDAVAETNEVVAFGYPLGKELASVKDDYPSVTISTGHITALRKINGQLSEIQLDASLNPGNSGGPILNMKGQVIGIEQAGIPGSGLNFAIPSNNLTYLLAKPLIALSPIVIPLAGLSREQDFTIHVVSFHKAVANNQVEMILGAGIGESRTFAAETADGVNFHVRAIPTPPARHSDALRLTVQDADNPLTCTLKDRKVRIDDRLIPLSRVRQIEQNSTAIVTLIDGQILAGKLAGLEDVEAQIGNTKATLDLSKSARIKIEALGGGTNAASAHSVPYRIIVKQSGNTISEQIGTIGIPVSLPLYYEGFNYEPGVRIDGQSGGSGEFADPWSEFGPGSGSSAMVAGSLSFGNLATSGNALGLTSGSPVGDSRHFKTSPGKVGGTLFISFLIKPLDAPPPPNAGGYFCFYYGDLGIGWGGLDYCLFSQSHGGAMGTKLKAVADQTVFMVVRITFRNGNDIVDLFMNPVPGRPLPARPDVSKTDVDTGAPTDCHFGANVRCVFDELRFGRTYEEVSPIQP